MQTQLTKNARFSTLLALNGVSGFAHLAQFGLLYPLVALYLSARGLPAWEVGVVGTLFWSGMLLGSTGAPSLMFFFGARRVVGLATVLTVLAALGFAQLPLHGSWPNWLLWGAVGSVVGLGTGLRWVANESWLYSLCSADRLGTVVGWHETLIHAVQALGPMVIAAVGLASVAGFYWAAVAAALCFLVLPFAREPMPTQALATRPIHPAQLLMAMLRSLRTPQRGAAARLGIWAGLMDGVLYGMFAVYCVQRGVSAQQAAVLMVVFGLGGLVTSAPLGMLCDRKGVAFALRLMAYAGMVMAAVLQLPLEFAQGAALWLAAAVLGMLSPLTLTMIVATQDASRPEYSGDLGQAIGQASLAFTLGTVAGPALAGWVLDAGGALGYTALTALLCWAGLGLNVRPAAPTH